MSEKLQKIRFQLMLLKINEKQNEKLQPSRDQMNLEDVMNSFIYMKKIFFKVYTTPKKRVISF